MMEVELTQPLPAVSRDGEHRRAWVLARLHTEPVGACVLALGEDTLAPGQFAGLLWEHLREPVAARFAAAGLPQPPALGAEGLTACPGEWPFLLGRSQVLQRAPFISVVLCTRDRADRLETSLHQLDLQAYPRFEVVVVDNAPAGDAVRSLVRARQARQAGPDAPGAPSYRYVVEPRPGLSWARNAGVAAAAGEIIAFCDDDEEADSHWLAEIARGFAAGDDIGCVTGLILPTRLDTPAQDWFERAGGHSKSRGFQPAVFSPDRPQNPLYPLPPFGAGGNMAFRRETLARIGGFDVAMGAGTPALGGEDTLAFTLALLAGYRIAYQPAAFVRHHHYAGLDGLQRQMRGYSVGLTAYYTALLRHRPGVFPGLLKLVPAAAGYLRGPKAAGPVVPPDPLPGHQAWRRGLAVGPAAYLLSVRRQAKAAAGGRTGPAPPP
jgi:glycosyltransferase involved in cell wall biosynthesis